MNPLLIEAFPELIQELQILLKKEGLVDLLPQLSQLRLIDRCHCGVSECATICTGSKNQKTWGKDHWSVVLESKKGFIIIDIKNKRIVEIEILCRNEIRSKLNKLLPCKRKKRRKTK